jgi:hypothetical protein
MKLVDINTKLPDGTWMKTWVNVSQIEYICEYMENELPMYTIFTGSNRLITNESGFEQIVYAYMALANMFK